MKKLGLSLLVGTAAAALVTATAMPASAAPGDTVTTFDLTGTGIAITVGATAGLTNGSTATATQDITGSLGGVTVTDGRGIDGAWNASAVSTVFTGTVSGITSTGVSYSAGAASGVSGAGTPVSSGAAVISGGAAEVFGNSAVAGNNAATFTPTLTVTLPAGALADTYTGTVTTSVA